MYIGGSQSIIWKFLAIKEGKIGIKANNDKISASRQNQLNKNNSDLGPSRLHRTTNRYKLKKAVMW